MIRPLCKQRGFGLPCTSKPSGCISARFSPSDDRRGLARIKNAVSGRDTMGSVPSALATIRVRWRVSRSTCRYVIREPSAEKLTCSASSITRSASPPPAGMRAILTTDLTVPGHRHSIHHIESNISCSRSLHVAGGNFCIGFTAGRLLEAEMIFDSLPNIKPVLRIGYCVYGSYI